MHFLCAEELNNVQNFEKKNVCYILDKHLQVIVRNSCFAIIKTYQAKWMLNLQAFADFPIYTLTAQNTSVIKCQPYLFTNTMTKQTQNVF